MAKLSKRQEYLSTLEEKKYSVSEAIQFLKSGPKANFEESVDVSINLGIDAGSMRFRKMLEKRIAQATGAA